jgi:hypothetical protein
MGVTEMRYFTIQWAKGEYSDKEYEKVFANYWKNLENIKNQLPDRMYYFAKNIDLHDGLIKQILYKDKSNLEIVITCGDLQKGYSEISIKYTSISVIPKITKKIIGEIQQNKVEILSDEIDISDKIFVHRFLIYPFKEFEIYFSGFDFTQKS